MLKTKFNQLTNKKFFFETRLKNNFFVSISIINFNYTDFSTEYRDWQLDTILQN